MIHRDQIMDALRSVPDPEMPISIVDLGLVEAVRINRVKPPMSSAGPATGTPHNIEIDLLPTFIGCPALEMIAGDVQAKIGNLPGVDHVKVKWLFDPPWSVDRITPTGRESLREHGVTVPTPGSGNHLHVAGHEHPQSVILRTSAIPCPFCGSTSTYLDSPFGPTRCRTIYYCDACRNSFEHLKRI